MLKRLIRCVILHQALLHRGGVHCKYNSSNINFFLTFIGLGLMFPNNAVRYWIQIVSIRAITYNNIHVMPATNTKKEVANVMNSFTMKIINVYFFYSDCVTDSFCSFCTDC